MADIINLRQARKQKARAEKDATAAANRLTYGRTKAEKALTKARQGLTERALSGHQRDAAPSDDGADNPSRDGGTSDRPAGD